VLNGEKHLEKTILSVINQSYKNIQYIIIDGGSTDGTVEIIKKYQHQIDFWISEPDNGIYDAMNKGIGYATGDLIGIINSDDHYIDDSIELVARAVVEYPEADVFHGNLIYIQKSGIKEIRRSRENLSKYKLYKMPVNHPTVFIRASCYKKYGMYDTKYKFAADFDLILKYLIDYKLIFKYMNHTIAFMHGGGTSSTLSHKNLNELEDVLTYRKAPYLIILRCKIGYYWLMFIENIKKYKTIYKLFSLYYYVRKNVFSVI
jgi:glycosyltransferase involved in cell wall biosynthesis